MGEGDDNLMPEQPGEDETPVEPTAAPGPKEGYPRDEKGRFLAGNKGGPGNRRLSFYRQLRDRLDEALFTVCSRDRLITAIDAILVEAEAGSVRALKILLERICGPAMPPEAMKRLAQLEQAEFEQEEEQEDAEHEEKVRQMIEEACHGGK